MRVGAALEWIVDASIPVNASFALTPLATDQVRPPLAAPRMPSTRCRASVNVSADQVSWPRADRTGTRCLSTGPASRFSSENGPSRLNPAVAAVAAETGFKSACPRSRMVGAPSNHAAGLKCATSAFSCASGTGANGVKRAVSCARASAPSASISTNASSRVPLARNFAVTPCSRNVDTACASARSANGLRASMRPLSVTLLGPC